MFSSSPAGGGIASPQTAAMADKQARMAGPVGGTEDILLSPGSMDEVGDMCLDDFADFAAALSTTPRSSGEATWSTTSGAPMLPAGASATSSPIDSTSAVDSLSPTTAFVASPTGSSYSSAQQRAGNRLPEAGGGPPSGTGKAFPPPASAGHTAPLTDPARTHHGGGSHATVCLLLVASRQGDHPTVTPTANTAMTSAACGGAAQVIAKVKEELARHGLTSEEERFESGEKVVQHVKMLADHGMCYRMVLMEVGMQGSQAAAATARDLRAANPQAPIVAFASRETLQVQREIVRQNFNACLLVPIDHFQVSELVHRYLVGRTEHDAAAGAARRGSPATTATVAAMEERPQRPNPPAAHRGRALRAFRTGLHSSAACTSAETTESHQKQQLSHLPSKSFVCDAGWTTAAGRCDDSRTLPEPAPFGHVSTTPEWRSFGGKADDRSSPSRLFENDVRDDDAQDREFGFVFKHGTVVLKVEENEDGTLNSMVHCACEYATTHFGNLAGKSMKELLSGEATNQMSARSILEHIETGDSDRISMYINLKCERDYDKYPHRDTASFISLRSLANGPDSKEEVENLPRRLPAWYVLKICLPSTIGVIALPDLLLDMYSRDAMGQEVAPTPGKRGKTGVTKTATRGKCKSGVPRRAAKKVKTLPEA